MRPYLKQEDQATHFSLVDVVPGKFSFKVSPVTEKIAYRDFPTPASALRGKEATN